MHLDHRGIYHLRLRAALVAIDRNRWSRSVGMVAIVGMRTQGLYADFRIQLLGTMPLFSPPPGPYGFQSEQEDLMSTGEMAHGATGEKAELKSFGKPDDIRSFPKGRL